MRQRSCRDPAIPVLMLTTRLSDTTLVTIRRDELVNRENPVPILTVVYTGMALSDTRTAMTAMAIPELAGVKNCLTLWGRSVPTHRSTAMNAVIQTESLRRVILWDPPTTRCSSWRKAEVSEWPANPGDRHTLAQRNSTSTQRSQRERAKSETVMDFLKPCFQNTAILKMLVTTPITDIPVHRPRCVM